MIKSNRFSIDEIYHCYNRGVDKRITFLDSSDYIRFIELLFLCNDKNPKQRSNLGKISHKEIFDIKRGSPIVAIGAWTLMPNHFHLLIKEIVEGGISTFVGTLINSYTKYFNIKNERNGNLFIKPFLSKHITEDQHFSNITQYIHLNSAEIFEPKWKIGKISNLTELEKNIMKYQYSSMPDYYQNTRNENQILDNEFKKILSSDLPSATELIKNVLEYNTEVHQPDGLV